MSERDQNMLVLCYSGGLDSTVLLFDFLSQDKTVKALSINYGQRHSRELDAAARIAGAAGVEHHVLDLSSMRSLLAGSALTDPAVNVPHGHYEEESMKSTVVPNRNMIFLAVASAWALSVGAATVAIAAHGGDHAIYPDCRPLFFERLGAALEIADWSKVALVTPYLEYSKSDICRRGAELKAPLELTWSCYEGGRRHCGRCGTCVERREAFELAGISDPTHYAQQA